MKGSQCIYPLMMGCGEYENEGNGMGLSKVLVVEG